MSGGLQRSDYDYHQKRAMDGYPPVNVGFSRARNLMHLFVDQRDWCAVSGYTTPPFCHTGRPPVTLLNRSRPNQATKPQPGFLRSPVFNSTAKIAVDAKSSNTWVNKMI